MIKNKTKMSNKNIYYDKNQMILLKMLNIIFLNVLKSYVIMKIVVINLKIWQIFIKVMKVQNQELKNWTKV